MKRLNNKGITLVELIVSFAIVGVAIIYFFQTLYTVKKIYSISREETQAFVDKTYALRIVDAYIDEKGFDALSKSKVCPTYFKCNDLSKVDDDKIYKVTIKMENGNDVVLYKYHN